jgi:hypothetical protein
LKGRRRKETMRSNRPFRVVLTGVLLLAALVLASCTEQRMMADTRPRAWVGGPPDGSEVPLGAVSVMCHGYAGAGVTQLELWVNGAFASRAANASPGSEYFTENLTFETTGPGSYVVHCSTYDQDGGMAQSHPVTLRVTGEAPTATTVEGEVPTATPTSTEVPPTVTVPPPPPTSVPPTATRIPPSPTRIPPSATPKPPTATPQLVKILSFEVSKSQINLGECVRFTWQVQAPTAIYFDGEGVGNAPDFRDRCPTQTRDFELKAEGNGGPVTERVTVVVIQPSPTVNTGPSITKVSESTNDVDWPEPFCTQCQYPGQVTISASISDPDGVTGAKLTYRINATGGQWRSLPMSQGRTGAYSATISGESLQNSLNPPVPSGVVCSTTSTLQYYVQAYDGMNNYSESPWGTVTVHYCYIIK